MRFNQETEINVQFIQFHSICKAVVLQILYSMESLTLISNQNYGMLSAVHNLRMTAKNC